jgi:hypothetical protein
MKLLRRAYRAIEWCILTRGKPPGVDDLMEEIREWLERGSPVYIVYHVTKWAGDAEIEMVTTDKSLAGARYVTRRNEHLERMEVNSEGRDESALEEIYRDLLPETEGYEKYDVAVKGIG